MLKLEQTMSYIATSFPYIDTMQQNGITGLFPSNHEELEQEQQEQGVRTK